MKALVQRVHDAAVRVDGTMVGSIGRGILALVGVGHDDDEADASRLAERVIGLRIFEDDEGKMNHSLADLGAELLVVSQFTLMGDTRRGRRPSFGAAAEPTRAAELVEEMASCAEKLGCSVSRGRFGAHMDIQIHADGPVTLALDTKEKRSG
ncbi:MAG: D-tyrosyl-tRNA(Tyr) deacylase [Hyphomicrobiaceae bacterium]|jgi:D-tyrosyl-tRNA(Tyr) deacylase